MDYATAQDLLSATDRRYKDVKVNGKTFRIQSLTEGERFPIELLLTSEDQSQRSLFKCALLAATLVDAKGNRILTDEQAKDLLEVDSGYTSPLFAAINKLVGFDEEDIKGVEKN